MRRWPDDESRDLPTLGGLLGRILLISLGSILAVLVPFAVIQLFVPNVVAWIIVFMLAMLVVALVTYRRFK